MFGSLRGKRVTVMGLGRFGGGIGAVRYLAEQGARVTVTDLACEDQLADSLDAIADVRLERLCLGEHAEDDFRRAELIVASPAVPHDHPLLRMSRVPVTTEIGLFWSRCPGRVIGVTGTVGKSTTAAMIHAVLSADSRTAWLGGNIGGSLLSEVERIAADDLVVLELSSFQLEYLQPLRPRAEAAVITNFHANHLDRHGTIEAYRAAKQLLLRWQSPRDVAVLNRDDPDVSTWPRSGRTFEFGTESLHSAPALRAERAVFVAGSKLSFVCRQEQSSFPFRQRRGPAALNAAAAAAAAFAVGVDAATIVKSLNAFRGLPHRLEELGEIEGRIWVNDSKATTPEAAIAAIQAFSAPIRLIAGGADKGVDLTPLVEAIRGNRVHVYLSGQTAKTIASQLVPHGATIAEFDSFDESVRAARSDSRPGDVILLSPGCASWGQFSDYRARGERFRGLAHKKSG